MSHSSVDAFRTACSTDYPWFLEELGRTDFSTKKGTYYTRKGIGKLLYQMGKIVICPIDPRSVFLIIPRPDDRRNTIIVYKVHIDPIKKIWWNPLIPSELVLLLKQYFPLPPQVPAVLGESEAPELSPVKSSVADVPIITESKSTENLDSK